MFLTIFYDDSSWDMTQWRSNRVYSAHGPSAVRAQNLPDVVFIQDKSPISAKNRFRVNIYFSLPWMELALRSSNVSLAWIQSPYDIWNSVSLHLAVSFLTINCTQQPNHYQSSMTLIFRQLSLVSFRSVRVFVHSCRPSLPFWKLPICC